MLTKAQVKDIRSLTLTKYRAERKTYIVEGDKMCREWLAADVSVEQIIAVKDWLAEQESAIAQHREAIVVAVTDSELARISSLQTPNKVLLVVRFPDGQDMLPTNEWSIAIDKLQDPGNMGTIIRIADWYGINHIVASPDSVDFYNTKVLQAAMGGHLRVQLHSADLPVFLKQIQIPILATTLDGKNIHETASPEAAVLVIGNESKGVSEEVLAFATQKIMIPRRGGAESLNAAVATGICCALLLPPLN